MSAALETTLEWPRFCYTGPSMFDDNSAKKSPKKSPKNGSNKRLSSSSNNTESDGETGSIKDEQMVPIIGQPSNRIRLDPKVQPIRSEFAFSDLMRRMASKYQPNTNSSSDEQPSERPAERNPFSDALSALSHYLPYGPHAPFLNATPFLPFPGLNPGIETLAGSRALSALAEKLASQKRRRCEQEENLDPKSPAKRSKIVGDDLALDLSSTSTTEDDVDILSIDPPSPSNVEQWSIDKVVEFVSNVEACREYAQVFHEHSIDGSALLVLTESHLTRILGLKLGPAIRLRAAIQELKAITNCSD